MKISAGQQITVISRDDDGWWYGRTREGKEGYFPAAFVTVLSSTAQGSLYSAASGAAPTSRTPGLAELPPVTVVIQPPPQPVAPPILLPPMTSMAAMNANMNPMGAPMNQNYNLQGNFMSQSGMNGNSGPMMMNQQTMPPMYQSQMQMGQMGPNGVGMSMGGGGQMYQSMGQSMPQYDQFQQQQFQQQQFQQHPGQGQGY